MESAQERPVTRSRSRSKTPFLKTSSDKEANKNLEEEHTQDKKQKRVSKLNQIEESNDETIQQNQQNKSNQLITDYSSNETTLSNSLINKSQTQKTTIVTRSQIVTTATGSSLSKIDEKNNAGLNVGNSNIFLNTPSSMIKDVKQNHMNAAFIKMKTSTPIGVESGGGTVGSTTLQQQSSSTSFKEAKNGSLSDADHLAYREYKEAGEYWNKYPKTDYTYSKLSKYRREIAPGIIGMPNMSRKSLHSSYNSSNSIDYNSEQESYTYLKHQPYVNYLERQIHSSTLKRNDDIAYLSSEDEVDYHTKRTSLHYTSSFKKETIIQRIFKTIYSLYSFLLIHESGSRSYTAVRNQNDGVFKKIMMLFTRIFMTIFCWLYMGIVLALSYCVRILSTTSVASSTKRSRFLTIILLLLPLLIGTQYCLNPEKFPSSFDDFKHPNFPISFPNYNINLSDYINEELKLSAIEKYYYSKRWVDDYFMYLKSVSTNILNEAQKLWLENFN